MVFRAKAVRDPGSHARAGAEAVASVELKHGLGVDAGVAVHGIEDAKFVCVAGNVWQEIRDPEATFAALFEGDD